MSVEVSESENSDDSSNFSQFSKTNEHVLLEETNSEVTKNLSSCSSSNILRSLFNRQIYGRFTRNSKARTENLFSDVPQKCKFSLSSLVPDYETMNHIYMGFTLCGQYFISFTEKALDLASFSYPASYEYELYIWRFIPGEKLQYISKHRIFKQLRGLEVLDKITFMQFPRDPYKIVCYGLASTSPAMLYISILTLPFPKSCKHCHRVLPKDDAGWCAKHGFVLHFMFSMSQPCPSFDPHISLAYPDYLVINTGHYIHILNVRTLDPPQTTVNLSNLFKEDDLKLNSQPASTFNDTLSEVSESPSDCFTSNNSVVDAIIEDFNEYDMEGNECNKPFHELNISCEPLNVTGKSYHNTLVQNIVDPRFKRLQNTVRDEYLFSVPHSSGVQKGVEKNKTIDKKIADKAYEFTEENEKCEKLSLFRKKRLAEKKYEFSEDNSENIVPFNSLRKDRRYNLCIRSPEFSNLFLSPRSPMQSPNNSRNGQFSPSSARNLYCASLRNSPHHSKSPISPKDARKFYVYSPSMDSDCSDSESRLILRMPGGHFSSSSSQLIGMQQSGLLIVVPKSETPKWIKKVVRRFSNGDFENSSLLSGQSRDDYNIPIEIPLLVNTLNEQHLDVVPEFKLEQMTEIQLIVTQRTFDCEQFVQKRAHKLCLESKLEFLHCEDYDIKINYICPLDGHIVCQAVIKIGALESVEPYSKPENYTTDCVFLWNIATDSFEVVESSEKLQPSEFYKAMPHADIPATTCKGVLVMDYCCTETKAFLRDYNNCYEVYMCVGSEFQFLRPYGMFDDDFTDQESVFSDSD